MTVIELIDNASRLGTVALMMLVIYGGAKAIWVFGWVYRDKVDECEYWRGVAERLLNITETTTEAAQPLIEQRRLKR